MSTRPAILNGAGTTLRSLVHGGVAVCIRPNALQGGLAARRVAVGSPVGPATHPMEALP
jgi:hypothetical protein